MNELSGHSLVLKKSEFMKRRIVCYASPFRNLAAVYLALGEGREKIHFSSARTCPHMHETDASDKVSHKGVDLTLCFLEGHLKDLSGLSHLWHCKPTDILTGISSSSGMLY